MSEKSITNGTVTSANNRAEVTHISRNGLVLWVRDREYYLFYDKFPWFKRAAVDDVFDVQLLGQERIRWNALDIDLSLSIITHPDKYTLISK